MMRLSNEQRVEVITLIEEEYSTHYIANKIDVHQSTVVKTHQHIRETSSIKDKLKHQYYWKRPKDPLRSPHVKLTVKFSSRNIMVWGCFTLKSVGNLCRINGEVDGIGFQQDNDPKHTSNCVKDWFFNNSVEVLD
ncbi:hypothetical protein RCL_jg23169.t1 [Rhizophagus clarus]|uniref:Transposase Tc1-like domain-containing protein n=1 Tax=Rhizophagus clarus TaxID=94130 RepID=A0A8H3QHN1_9GLOM|nr:hypothetical protein RCL_jg23169.t1 [Rhizophagus clarus]